MWQVRTWPDEVHVIPLDDLIEHEESDECICGPDIEYFDPDTHEAYQRPLIGHHSLDGREANE